VTRAADDFAMIRGRVEELRRERARVAAVQESPSSIGPRPNEGRGSAVSTGPEVPNSKSFRVKLSTI